MSAIEEISAAVASVAETAGPSIVTIGRNARGSGVVIADGQVLTNAHNLRGGEVTVTFGDGRSTRGTVTGVDPDGDLAVVSVDTAGARAIDWGAGDGLAVGSPVFGVAATFGGGVRVTFGLVSSVSRSFRGPGGRRSPAASSTPRRWRRLVGRRHRRCRREVPRAEYEPDRRGLLPRFAGRCRAAVPRGCAGSGRVGEAAAPGRGDRTVARGAPAAAFCRAA